MKTQDLIDPNFKQKPVVLIKEEAKMQIMANPIYFPILMSLRDGFKTIKEIEEEYNKFIVEDLKKQGIKDRKKIKEMVDKKKRSDKSLYRYIQHLIDADFVVLVGKRIAMEKSMTEKIFARTAKFFFVDSYYEKMICANQGCIDSLSQLLGLIYDVPPLEKTNLKQFTNLMKECSKKITSILFTKKSEEFVQIVENLSLSEITAVLQTLSIIDLVNNPKDFKKLLKSIEKA